MKIKVKKIFLFALCFLFLGLVGCSGEALVSTVVGDNNQEESVTTASVPFQASFSIPVAEVSASALSGQSITSQQSRESFANANVVFINGVVNQVYDCVEDVSTDENGQIPEVDLACIPTAERSVLKVCAQREVGSSIEQICSRFNYVVDYSSSETFIITEEDDFASSYIDSCMIQGTAGYLESIVTTNASYSNNISVLATQIKSMLTSVKSNLLSGALTVPQSFHRVASTTNESQHISLNKFTKFSSVSFSDLSSDTQSLINVATEVVAAVPVDATLPQAYDSIDSQYTTITSTVLEYMPDGFVNSEEKVARLTTEPQTIISNIKKFDVVDHSVLPPTLQTEYEHFTKQVPDIFEGMTREEILVSANNNTDINSQIILLIHSMNSLVTSDSFNAFYELINLDINEYPNSIDEFVSLVSKVTPAEIVSSIPMIILGSTQVSNELKTSMKQTLLKSSTDIGQLQTLIDELDVFNTYFDSNSDKSFILSQQITGLSREIELDRTDIAGLRACLNMINMAFNLIVAYDTTIQNIPLLTSNPTSYIIQNPTFLSLVSDGFYMTNAKSSFHAAIDDIVQTVNLLNAEVDSQHNDLCNFDTANLSSIVTELEKLDPSSSDIISLPLGSNNIQFDVNAFFDNPPTNLLNLIPSSVLLKIVNRQSIDESDFVSIGSGVNFSLGGLFPNADFDTINQILNQLI